MKPYYYDDTVTLYLGDAREVLPVVASSWAPAERAALITDPPYPNNAGHFDDAVGAARELLAEWDQRALVFWNELERPPVRSSLVAVHIWHRANVNGRPYEPIYDFATDGAKRRSDVFRHAAIFDGVGPGCWEYLGHPTQKPVALMHELVRRTRGLVVDPFAGSGSTLRAAKNLGRRAVGVEINESYCEIAAQRLAQEVLAA